MPDLLGQTAPRAVMIEHFTSGAEVARLATDIARTLEAALMTGEVWEVRSATR